MPPEKTGEEPEVTAEPVASATEIQGAPSDEPFTDDLQRMVGSILAQEADEEERAAGIDPDEGKPATDGDGEKPAGDGDAGGEGGDGGGEDGAAGEEAARSRPRAAVKGAKVARVPQPKSRSGTT